MEQVIDRANRRLLARRARQMVTCRISAQTFDNWLMEPDDPIDASDDDGVGVVCYLGFYTLYSDFHTEYLTGEWALNRDDRRIVARWILFLYTDLPYEWTTSGNDWGRQLRKLLNRLTRGRVHYEEPVLKESGDKEIWPFFRRADYEAVLQRPPLLCGKQTA